MKQKCSFILRASLALVLTVLMVLGSVSTVIAAVADVAAGDDALPLAAKKGFDIAATGADADVAETGAISKITAQVTGKTSHSSTTFPLEFTESLNKDSWYGIRINFSENGDHYCKASDNNNITVGTVKELGWGNGNGNNDSGMSWFQATKSGTFSFSIYTSGGKNYVLVSEAKTPLSTPSITIGGQSSAVNVTSGSSTTVTITNFSSKFSDAATTSIYTLKLYKEGSSTAIKSMTTASTTFTPDASAKYYVKCEPTSSYASSWSESTSNKVDVTLTKDTTIYVKKALASTFSNIHIWSNTNDNWTGAWPGQALSDWTQTSDGNYYHKTFTNSYSDFKLILNNNSSPQTSDSDAYATGKSYYIDSATANSAAVLTEGVPKASTITYNTGTGYSFGGTKPTSAYTGETVSFTVTPDTGYRIDSVKYKYGSSTTKDATAGSNNTYTFTMPAYNVTIEVTASKVNTVNAVTNKTTRGTISVDKSTAAKDEVVKITVSPAAGILKTLTATYTTSGNTYECAVTNGIAGNTWTKVIASGGAAAPLKARGSVEIAEVGANIALAAVGSSQTVNMIMQEDSAVTINATFDTYSGDSTWYYNGYDDSGNALSGYHGKQMTESMVSGEKFSYYHVEGRTGTSQLMTVSNGAASSGTRYVYFTVSNNGGWSTDANSQYAYFYNESGVEGKAWPGYKMTKYTTNDYGQDVYRVEIPTSSSPTKVIFNNGSTAKHQTTDVTDLSKGGYYLLTTTHSEDGKTIHDWQSYDCSYPSAGYSTGTEYFYGSDSDASTIYSTDANGKSIFNTTGFYRHGTNSKNYAKPRLTNSDVGDYYVNVLYPGKTYTINGVTKTIGTDPVVIWSTEPLAGDDENVTVYAKDGSIRSESNGSTYANIANTKIYAADGTTAVGTNHTGNIANQTYETYKAAKGDTLVIKTQIGATDSGNLSNADALKAKYYVRGFCVNGEVSVLLEWSANGLYTLTYKIPEDTEITKFEITPIYYLKDTTANPIVTYRVTGFTDELKAVGAGKPGWGDTLYTYPFYGKLGSQNNALGAYPGQPMVYYKGQYQMQIPQKSTAWDIYYDDGALSDYSGNTAKANAVANTAVSGVTMSNGYYDIVHRQVMGYGSNGTSSDHVQTYDYGDFFKIFNEKEPVDNIVFDFKYRTKKHNFESQPANSITKTTLDTNYGTNGNGFELLTNFHGRNVDLFGTPLSGDAADPSKTTPVYVISIGGVNGSAGVENIAGYYATEWMVYGSSNGTNYSRITAGNKNSIPPEVLVLNNNSTSFNNTTYPSADASHTLTDWKALYTALEAYRGKPVLISYEAADAQIGAGNYATSGGGGATRNDGRWLYSKNGENITSNIKIQYSDDNGATYNDLNTTTPQVNGLSAYFTNSEVEEGAMTFSTTIDPDKTFDFEAKTTNANYKFVGWFMEDGTKITTDNASHTERSGSYTFVAKFMKVESGQLIISHNVATDDTHKGSGKVSVSAVVYDGEEVVRTYDAANSITLDEKIIKSDSTYKIKVTLSQAPTGEDTFYRTTCSPTGTTYLNPNPVTTAYNTKDIEFYVSSLFSDTTQTVMSLMYSTYYTKTEYSYKYTFKFNDRSGADKSFVREGTLSSAQREAYVTGTGNADRVLDEAFVNKLRPAESNFNQTIIFTVNSADRTFTKDGNNYSIEKTIIAEQTDNNTVTATFDLPYAYNANGCATAAVPDLTEQTNFVINNVAYSAVIKKGDEYVTAPKTVNDGGTTKYFQYWSVAKTTAPTLEVARCYFNSFNLVAYDNYTIKPIYLDTQSTGIAGSGTFSTVSYLSTTRNQYNGDGVDADKSARTTAADILYNDFVLAYNHGDVEIYKNDSTSNAISELGYVVERVQKLEVGQDGKPYTDAAHYSGKAAKTDAEIQTFISKYSGSTTSGTLTKVALDKDKLDNKNRIEFYDAYYNSAGWSNSKQSPAQTYGYKNYVYKVYTYMIVDGTVKLCENPVYFTMYDEATK